MPNYVLDPKLHDGQKILKWYRHLKSGQFLGFSDSHSSLVANVCHLSMGYMSPQYHLIFDDLFQTVFSSGNDALLDDFYNHLFDSNCDFYSYDDEIILDDPLVCYPHPLEGVCLSEPERQDCCRELEECHCIAEDCEWVKWIDTTPDDPSDSLPNLIEQSDSDSETSACLPPVFVPERGNATAQPYADDESILPINSPEGVPPNIPLIEFDVPVASDLLEDGKINILRFSFFVISDIDLRL